MIDTIFFDAGGTLVEASPPPQQVFLNILKDFNYNVKDLDIEKGFETGEIFYQKNVSKKRDSGEFWSECNRVVLKKAGVNENIDFYAKKIYDEFFNYLTFEVFDDVFPILEKLKKFNLGVISNSNGTVEKILENLGLKIYFSVVIDSEVVGFDKPSPKIFEIAVKRIGARFESSIHVGDSYKEDYLGAKNVGMKAILLDRKKA
ncbi:MAG: HAD-IA family hydrolase, partial [Candidatus Methanofastidiosia archaeon]